MLDRHLERPRGFALLIGAQFVSALADNALLLVVIAQLAWAGAPAWMAPLLKLVFTAAYVLLAPFVGSLADAWPKARVMLAANATKALACAGLLLGAPPLAAFCLAGAGAAVYSPAKYGLVTELVPARGLVAANGWIEVSTVVSILLGTVLGGWLAGPQFAAVAGGWLASTDRSAVLLAAVGVVLALYALAAALNLGIPDSGARYPAAPPWHRQLDAFAHDQRRLWGDPLGQISLATTTLFWGIGATLQFVVLRWADEQLGLTLSQSAYLQGLSAVGVVVGAALAGRWIRLDQALRVLPLGIAMGAFVPLMLTVDRLPMAVGLLTAIGALGGLFVVPLNALLQHRGCTLLSAGRSIAVQNFNENASVLLLLAVYAACTAQGVSLAALIWGYGAAVAGLMALIAWRQRVLAAAPHPFSATIHKEA